MHGMMPGATAASRILAEQRHKALLLWSYRTASAESTIEPHKDVQCEESISEFGAHQDVHLSQNLVHLVDGLC